MAKHKLVVELDINPALQSRMALFGMDAKKLLNRLLTESCRTYENNLHDSGEFLESPNLVSAKVVEDD